MTTAVFPRSLLCTSGLDGVPPHPRTHTPAQTPLLQKAACNHRGCGSLGGTEPSAGATWEDSKAQRLGSMLVPHSHATEAWHHTVDLCMKPSSICSPNGFTWMPCHELTHHVQTHPVFLRPACPLHPLRCSRSGPRPGDGVRHHRNTRWLLSPFSMGVLSLSPSLSLSLSLSLSPSTQLSLSLSLHK